MKIFSSLKSTAQDFLEPYKEKEPATYAAALEAVGGVLVLDGFVGIDHPFGGKKRPGILSTLGGIFFGIILIIGVPLVGSIMGINSMTATTTATVTSVGAPEQSTSTDRHGNTTTTSVCSMAINYTVGSQKYAEQSTVDQSSFCSLSKGQVITVSYNPKDPNSWMYNIQMWKWASIGGEILGVITLISSLFTFTIRLLSIIFGWKLLKQGRALAKTVPGGVNLGAIIGEIRTNFIGTVFSGNPVKKMAENFVSGGAPTPVPAAPTAAPSPEQTIPPVDQPQPPRNPEV